jgi:hypothetical protein
MLKLVLVILTIAAHSDYETWQMDVKTDLLNENLTEDVYIIQPEDFDDRKVAKRYANFRESETSMKELESS